MSVAWDVLWGVMIAAALPLLVWVLRDRGRQSPVPPALAVLALGGFFTAGMGAAVVTAFDGHPWVLWPAAGGAGLVAVAVRRVLRTGRGGGVVPEPGTPAAVEAVRQSRWEARAMGVCLVVALAGGVVAIMATTV